MPAQIPTLIESIPVAIRAFAERRDNSIFNRGSFKRPDEVDPSEYTLIFDTETNTDAAQQLRFGCFQVRKGNTLETAGIFYDPETLSADEIEILNDYAIRNDLTVGSVAEFISEIFLPYGYSRRAMIIGFNLPFDISRIAIGHGSARGKMMHGGFTFKLSGRKDRPAIQVKHLSRRASVLRFAVPGKQLTPRGMRRRQIAVQPHRGFFVDVKTLAAALTSRSFSLAGLGEFLGVASGKLETEEHGGPLTDTYLDYAMRDVQTTWECFLKLRDRYDAHGLTETPIYKIYSEAGLGKAYLKQMGIRPWKETQGTMPPELIGAIVSSYSGGRSEVHIRRDIQQIAYCDFLSMYPTVCVLMGLWRFVTAQGMTWHDATDPTRQMLDNITLADVQAKSFWPELATLVEVEPDDDLFPVRAKYGSEAHYTIGLNHLSSDKPLWFTLADCIAAKLLTGKTPRILRAIRFEPGPPQTNMQPCKIAGRKEFKIDPRRDDFYRRLIDQRTETKQRMKSAGAGSREQLDAAQMALKILANSTSYGIFFELNVEVLSKPEMAQCYASHEAGFSVKISQDETPGQYFHPLLATLITGAARLMLACAERLVLDAGLDWVFCDTDSLAIAKPSNMPGPEFLEAVEAVRGWFDPLNPYAKPGAILKLEDANYGLEGQRPGKDLAPLYCFAVSAKRYALFNLDDLGLPVIRKASAHGLGHLIVPYKSDDAPANLPAPQASLNDIGVDRWQHDVWHRIVSAALAGHPEQVRLDDLPGFNAPSVSRYAATTPELLRWFKRFNRGKPYREQVRPFGFMLAFTAGNTARGAMSGELVEGDGKRRGRRSGVKKLSDAPRAVAPFDKDITRAAKHCFDRDTGLAVAPKALKTYRQALLRYHLHPEAKFLGGDYFERGSTTRRHIQVTEVQRIGKEANRWEEQFYLGDDPEAQAEYGVSAEGQEQVNAMVQRAVAQFGQRKLAKAARISRNTLAAVVNGTATMPPQAVERIRRAVTKLNTSIT
ncbi:MAG: DNA polymerase [Proteobacteria bacterium]|nr:DNA polymerase [Pseudomonadota bacterium]